MGLARFWAGSTERKIVPHIPVLDRQHQTDGLLPREAFTFDATKNQEIHSAYGNSTGWAELERSLITERSRAGVKAAQRRGVKFGRKPKLSAEQIGHARKLIEEGEPRRYVADLLNVGRVTLYRAYAS